MNHLTGKPLDPLTHWARWLDSSSARGRRLAEQGLRELAARGDQEATRLIEQHRGERQPGSDDQ